MTHLTTYFSSDNVIMDLNERCRIMKELLQQPPAGSDPTYLCRLAHRLLNKTDVNCSHRAGLVNILEELEFTDSVRIPLDGRFELQECKDGSIEIRFIEGQNQPQS